jgi:hypothetical protein
MNDDRLPPGLTYTPSPELAELTAALMAVVVPVIKTHNFPRALSALTTIFCEVATGMAFCVGDSLDEQTTMIAEVIAEFNNLAPQSIARSLQRHRDELARQTGGKAGP